MIPPTHTDMDRITSEVRSPTPRASASDLARQVTSVYQSGTNRESPTPDCRDAVRGSGGVANGRQRASLSQETASAVPAITARPFEWRDPSTIEMRRWLYDWHYIRQFVAATIAPGGVGKSTLVAVEALAMATGRDLLGREPVERCRVWLWQGEDPVDEMQRRITAAMIHFRIDPTEVEGWLFLNSGRDDPICIAVQERDGVKVAGPVVDAMIATIRANSIDVVIIDPFVASHQVGENDNGAVDRVTKTWARIADKTNTAIELVHHSRKTGGAETTVEDGRGASALLATVRSARVLNVMSKEEADRAGVDNAFAYVRIDKGKSNLAPRVDQARWLHMATVPLGNGPLGTEGDKVGVFEPWQWPNPFDGLSVSDLEKVQATVARGRWRKDSQSKEWVGIAIADTLGLDISDKADKSRVKLLQRTWTANGSLVEFTEKDEKRNERTYVRAGDGREGEAA